MEHQPAHRGAHGGEKNLTRLRRARLVPRTPAPLPFRVSPAVALAHRPTVTEAIERLQALKRKGPHAEAFTFRQTFPPPDAPQSERPAGYGEECPAS